MTVFGNTQEESRSDITSSLLNIRQVEAAFKTVWDWRLICAKILQGKSIIRGIPPFMAQVLFCSIGSQSAHVPRMLGLHSSIPRGLVG
jgi:hypothetical protein